MQKLWLKMGCIVRQAIAQMFQFPLRIFLELSQPWLVDYSTLALAVFLASGRFGGLDFLSCFYFVNSIAVYTAY